MSNDNATESAAVAPAAKPTLGAYLLSCAAAGQIDHALRVQEVMPGGMLRIYIHPHGADGETLDFLVSQNALSQVLPTAITPAA